MTPAEFRQQFTQFADAAKYPDAQVQFYLEMAELSLPASRWGELYGFGLALFTAHNLALDQMSNGPIPGRSQFGLVASKSVGPASVSYDNSLFMLPNSGHWSLTMFGTRFLQTARLVGAGGVQL